MRDLIKSLSQTAYQGTAVVYKSKIGFLHKISEADFPDIFFFEAVSLNSYAACSNYLNFDINLPSEKLARSLALEAYSRACNYGYTKNLFGLSLVEENEKLHIALQTNENTILQTIDADISSELITDFVIKTMFYFLSTQPLFNHVKNYNLQSNSLLSTKVLPLFNNETDYVFPFHEKIAPKAVFPGNWNPLTQEHLYMATIAEAFCDNHVYFEATINPLGNPPLDLIDIERLIKQFDGLHLVITRAPTFLDKAKLFPNSTFIVGIDTWLKIIDPTYYDVPISEIIRQFKQNQVKFLVFGRQQEDKFLSLPDDLRFGIARRVPQHILSKNPEDDYGPEEEQRATLKKEIYKANTPRERRSIGL